MFATALTSRLRSRVPALTAATNGVMACRHVRRRGDGLIGFDWHCHDTDFQFNFVLAGTSRVENKHGERHTLGPGDVICEPGLFQVREFDFSEDYDVIQIGVPAERLTTISYGQERPVCTDHDENCWQKNRRAHLSVAN